MSALLSLPVLSLVIVAAAAGGTYRAWRLASRLGQHPGGHLARVIAGALAWLTVAQLLGAALAAARVGAPAATADLRVWLFMGQQVVLLGAALWVRRQL